MWVIWVGIWLASCLLLFLYSISRTLHSIHEEIKQTRELLKEAKDSGISQLESMEIGIDDIAYGSRISLGRNHQEVKAVKIESRMSEL